MCGQKERRHTTRSCGAFARSPASFVAGSRIIPSFLLETMLQEWDQPRPLAEELQAQSGLETCPENFRSPFDSAQSERYEH